jgi:XTP/dITP diphosphohydrolase
MILHYASSNPGKLREFQQAAARFHSQGVCIEPLPDLRTIVPPEEAGRSFEENAIVKAVYYSRFSAELVFADDSGLVVDALGGEPGVQSARYAGPAASDQANNALLLERMRGIAARTARFVCVIALARQRELVATFTGVVEGYLTEEERGSGGFGYDPLFYYPPYHCTLAELAPEQKQKISHRGLALEQLLQFGTA